MGTKLYIKTFGCQMNEYDSQKTADILKNERNVIVTDNPDDADIILNDFGVGVARCPAVHRSF